MIHSKKKVFCRKLFFVYSIAMNTVSLRWINFYKWRYSECLSELQNDIVNKKTKLVVTPNPEMLYQASSDNELSRVLQSADYAIPDGAGIFVAYQITESRLPTILKYLILPYWCLRAVIHGKSLTEKYGERITGSRLTRDLLAFANNEKIPVTIIDPNVRGNTPGDKAKKNSQSTMGQILSGKYPACPLNVIITDDVPEKLPEHGIIFATHGTGKQEKILAALMEKFPHCGLAMGVGGSVDLITGFRQPAPLFFQKFGGEWLYRLYKNPKRHFVRMKKVLSFLHQCIKK